MTRLKDALSGVVVSVTPEKAERLRSAGWLPVGEPVADPPPKPRAKRRTPKSGGSVDVPGTL